VDKKGGTSRSSQREKAMLEEKPAKFERLTIEFNAIYNSLLSNVRDKNVKQSQQKFIQLYEIYRSISKEDLSDEELLILEQQLKEVAGLIPSQEPPKIAMPLTIIAVVMVLTLFGGSITGMVTAETTDFQTATGIYADGNSVFQIDLGEIPSSVKITGTVLGEEGSRARIYLVDDGKELLIADEIVNNGESFFLDECIETCFFDDFEKSTITLIVRTEDAAVEIDGISYI